LIKPTFIWVEIKKAFNKLKAFFIGPPVGFFDNSIFAFVGCSSPTNETMRGIKILKTEIILFQSFLFDYISLSESTMRAYSFLIFISYAGCFSSFPANSQKIKGPLDASQCLDLNRQFLDDLQLDSVLKYSHLGMKLALISQDSIVYLLNKDFEGQYYYYEGLFERSSSVYFEILQEGNLLKGFDIVGRAYRMLGWINLENNQFDIGLTHFQQALDLLKKHGNQPDDVALTYYGIAIMNEFLGKIDLAKTYYDSSLNNRPGLKIRERAYVYAAYASLERSNDVLKSLDLASKGEQLLRGKPNHRDMYCRPLAELSHAYSLLGQPDKARFYANQAYAIYQTVPFRRRHVDLYKNIAKALDACGESQKAYLSMLDVKALNDSISNQRREAIISDLQLKYEAHEKLQQIKLLEQQNELVTQRAVARGWAVWITATASFIILVLGAVVYYNRNRFQKKIQQLETDKKLREQKEIIGRDLHDNLGSQLSSISLGLNHLNQDNKNSVQAIQDLADKAIAELRDSL
jgi:signal transduction histidine kinase